MLHHQFINIFRIVPWLSSSSNEEKKFKIVLLKKKRLSRELERKKKNSKKKILVYGIRLLIGSRFQNLEIDF